MPEQKTKCPVCGSKDTRAIPGFGSESKRACNQCQAEWWPGKVKPE